MRNRYLLFLQNNFSGEQFCFEVYNASCDPNYYRFEDFNNTLPADFKYGCYDYALLHCSIPYLIDFKPCLLDTVITADDKNFVLRELRPETGLFEFRPESGLDGRSEVWDPILGNDRVYIDM